MELCFELPLFQKGDSQILHFSKYFRAFIVPNFPSPLALTNCVFFVSNLGHLLDICTQEDLNDLYPGLCN